MPPEIQPVNVVCLLFQAAAIVETDGRSSGRGRSTGSCRTSRSKVSTCSSNATSAGASRGSSRCNRCRYCIRSHCCIRNHCCTNCKMSTRRKSARWPLPHDGAALLLQLSDAVAVAAGAGAAGAPAGAARLRCIVVIVIAVLVGRRAYRSRRRVAKGNRDAKATGHGDEYRQSCAIHGPKLQSVEERWESNRDSGTIAHWVINLSGMGMEQEPPSPSAPIPRLAIDPHLAGNLSETRHIHCLINAFLSHSVKLYGLFQRDRRRPFRLGKP